MTDTAGLLGTGPDPAFSAALFEPVAPVAFTAQPPKDEDGGGQGADFGKSSPVGLLVLLLFFIAVAFLVRSMTKHLKRVPASFDPPAEAEPDAEPKPDGEDEKAGEAKAEEPANGKSDQS